MVCVSYDVMRIKACRSMYIVPVSPTSKDCTPLLSATATTFAELLTVLPLTRATILS